MKASEILIGTGVVAALGAIGFVLYKKNAEAKQKVVVQTQAAQVVAQAQAVAQAEIKTATDIRAEYQAKAIHPVLSIYPAGSLLRAGTSQSVYLINELGQRQWVSSRAAFDKRLLNMADVKSITEAQMNKIPTGPALSGFRGLGYLNLR